jgi:ATP-dependent DNA helicase RecG
MSTALDRLLEAMGAREDEHLEFKEAKGGFHFDKLVKYCSALANEGGGLLVLGVTDRRPRRVVGTSAFADIERTKAGLVDRLRLRIDVDEVSHPDGRVVAFAVPSRAIGTAVPVDGAYWMRAGEDLVAMTPDMLRRIFEESGPDFSAEVCRSAVFSDLNPSAIDDFRRRWYQKAALDSILRVSAEQLLRDAELVTDAGVTYGALILFGTHVALGRHLGQAELVFEYRSSDVAAPANQREEFREGFFAWYDRLWALINLRNDRQHYQDGLFMKDIATFNEVAVREATLNAVAHRDYRLGGSVFIRQFPRRLEVVSPGGFPQGVTPENILDRQVPRNRRIADALGRCGLVERSGQGANRIFEACVREGKGLPDFQGTDTWQVSLTLHGQVQDGPFVRFLERVIGETQISFDTHDLLVLDVIRRDAPILQALRSRLPRLVDAGVVERIGAGRGAAYLLSKRFYAALGNRAGYTRRKGLDREHSKALLLGHVRESGAAGVPMAELQQVVPTLSRDRIKSLMKELRRESLVELIGSRRGSRWVSQ